MSCRLLEQADGVFGIAGKICEPGELWQSLGVRKQAQSGGGLQMISAGYDVLAIGGTQPGIGIDLGQRQLVRNFYLLKRAIPGAFVITHPAAVRVQPNPDDRESYKDHTGFSNSAGRLQIEAVKREIFCVE